LYRRKYSLERQTKTSNFTVYALGMDRIEVVNATLDFSTGNPVLLNQLTELRMMSKAWTEKNNSVGTKRNIKVKTALRCRSAWCRPVHAQNLDTRPANCQHCELVETKYLPMWQIMHTD
jgi:hypothetical protein